MSTLEDFDKIDKLLGDGKTEAAKPEIVWSPSATGSAKVKAAIPEGEVYELDPSKRYVIVVRKEILSLGAVEHLCQLLKAAGVKAVVMSYAVGPIRDGVQVMEDRSTR